MIYFNLIFKSFVSSLCPFYTALLFISGSLYVFVSWLSQAPNLSSSLQAVEAAQGFSHGRGRIIPSLSNERQDGFFYRDNHMNPRRTAQAVHGHNHFGVNKKYGSHKTFEVSRELVYGPRANKSNSCLGSSTRNNNLNQFVRRDKYNKTDFQIEYENAKFFMIKSYNEDDVHKSVKYNVWASTPNGNKKLDAVFWEAERLMKKGSKCPIFLFFSVRNVVVSYAYCIRLVFYKLNIWIL